MKILDIYSKENLNLITFRGVDIITLMDRFFTKFPSSYRENYDKNMENLEIYRVDEMMDIDDFASYVPELNVLLFSFEKSLPHELMHMSSANLEKKLFAFCKAGQRTLWENGLLEGMTEYLGCMATNTAPKTYFFEYFVVSMLSSIDNIFEPYFIPSYDGLISLFPNKRDICSLMYGLDFYHDKSQTIDKNTSKEEINRIRSSIKGVIDSLIDIELSFDNDFNKKKLYVDKFMDLIMDCNVDMILKDIYPEYADYAFYEINKRVLRRSR